MKASSAIGLAIAILGLFLGPTMEGSNVMAIINPSAMLIVLCGTLGATIAGAERWERPRRGSRRATRGRRRRPPRRSP